MDVNVIKINVGIMVNVDVSLENIKYVKKILFGALVYEVAKMINIEQVLLTIEWLRVMKL